MSDAVLAAAAYAAGAAAEIAAMSASKAAGKRPAEGEAGANDGKVAKAGARKKDLWLISAHVSKTVVCDNATMLAWFTNMIRFLSDWSSDVRGGGSVEGKKLRGFFLAYPQSRRNDKKDEQQPNREPLLTYHGALASFTRCKAANEWFPFFIVLKFNIACQQSSVHDKWTSKMATDALGSVQFGTHWSCKTSGTSLPQLCTAMQEWFLSPALSRSIVHVLPSMDELKLNPSSYGLSSQEEVVVVASQLMQLASQLGHPAYLREQSLRCLQGFTSCLQGLNESASSANVLRLQNKGLPVSLRTPVVTDPDVPAAAASCDPCQATVDAMRLLEGRINDALSLDVVSLTQASEGIRHIIVSMAKDLVQTQRKLADLEQRPLIFEKMSRVRNFGGSMNALPIATTEAIKAAEQFFAQAATPLKEVAKVLLPIAVEPPCICLKAFTASPFASDQVFDVTAECVPTVLREVLFTRQVQTPVLTAVMLCMEKNEQLCSDSRELLEDKDLGIEGAVVFKNMTQKMVQVVTAKVRSLQADCDKYLDGSLEGVHASIAPSTQFFFEATQKDFEKCLNDTSIGACEVFSIVLVCNTTTKDLVLCSTEMHSDGIAVGCCKEHKLPHKTAAVTMLRAAISAVAQGKRVHILLLGCNMHNLAELLAIHVDTALADAQCLHSSVPAAHKAALQDLQLSTVLRRTDVCFTNNVFPAGVLSLVLQTYAWNTDVCLEGTFKSNVARSLDIWDEAYKKQAINDPNQAGMGLHGLRSRYATQPPNPTLHPCA